MSLCVGHFWPNMAADVTDTEVACWLVLWDKRRRIRGNWTDGTKYDFTVDVADGKGGLKQRWLNWAGTDPDAAQAFESYAKALTEPTVVGLARIRAGIRVDSILTQVNLEEEALLQLYHHPLHMRFLDVVAAVHLDATGRCVDCGIRSSLRFGGGKTGAWYRLFRVQPGRFLDVPIVGRPEQTARSVLESWGLSAPDVAISVEPMEVAALTLVGNGRGSLGSQPGKQKSTSSQISSANRSSATMARCMH